MATFPALAYATPRKLPKASKLVGRVVVLDIAFAGGAGGARFETVTEPFLRGLGDRLAMWIDHHDHELHPRFADDPRFVLRTKREHPACPELVTEARVAAAGPVDTIVCHVDFDGLCAAAKWIRGGVPPYPEADADARAVDTCIGRPSPLGALVDRALRARPNDDGMRGIVVRFLAGGAADAGLRALVRERAAEYDVIEAETRALARRYIVEEGLALCDLRGVEVGRVDKTELLLLGQERARIAALVDDKTLTVAAAFDSGVDLVSALGLQGGMPTRVSVASDLTEELLPRLRALSTR